MWYVVGGWLICVVFAWGAVLFSIAWGLIFGPLAALIALIGSGYCKHGWRLR